MIPADSSRYQRYAEDRNFISLFVSVITKHQVEQRTGDTRPQLYLWIVSCSPWLGLLSRVMLREEAAGKMTSQF